MRSTQERNVVIGLYKTISTTDSITIEPICKSTNSNITRNCRNSWSHNLISNKTQSLEITAVGVAGETYIEVKHKILTTIRGLSTIELSTSLASAA